MLIFGDSGDNVLVGPAGDDEIYGLEGDDTLYGSSGNSVSVRDGIYVSELGMEIISSY